MKKKKKKQDWNKHLIKILIIFFYGFILALKYIRTNLYFCHFVFARILFSFFFFLTTETFVIVTVPIK